MKDKNIFAFSLALMLIASPAKAVVDPSDVLMNSLRQIQSAIEVVENIENNVQLKEINKLIGKKGAISPEMVDMGSYLDYKKYAPTLTRDLQKIVKNKGFESIPDTRKYVQKNLSFLNSTKMSEQAATLIKINERLNLSSMDAFRTAKSVASLTNKAFGESSSQLSKGASAENMHKKLVQEAAQDIQALKRDVSHNQLSARLLEVKANKIMADIQHSTSNTKKASETTQEQQKGDANEKNG